jgi:hypothetical protein
MKKSRYSEEQICRDCLKARDQAPRDRHMITSTTAGICFEGAQCLGLCAWREARVYSTRWKMW